MDFKALLFSAEGRLNRLSFFLSHILIGIVIIVISIILSLIFGTSVIGSILSAVISIVAFVIGIFLIIKRCHDFDKNGYFFIKYALAVIGIAIVLIIVSYLIFGIESKVTFTVPFIFEFIAMLYFYFKPGTDGANKYGNQPASLFDLGLEGFNKEGSNPVISENNTNNM